MQQCLGPITSRLDYFGGISLDLSCSLHTVANIAARVFLLKPVSDHNIPIPGRPRALHLTRVDPVASCGLHPLAPFPRPRPSHTLCPLAPQATLLSLAHRGLWPRHPPPSRRSWFINRKLRQVKRHPEITCDPTTQRREAWLVCLHCALVRVPACVRPISCALLLKASTLQQIALSYFFM